MLNVIVGCDDCIDSSSAKMMAYVSDIDTLDIILDALENGDVLVQIDIVKTVVANVTKPANFTEPIEGSNWRK